MSEISIRCMSVDMDVNVGKRNVILMEKEGSTNCSDGQSSGSNVAERQLVTGADVLVKWRTYKCRRKS